MSAEVLTPRVVLLVLGVTLLSTRVYAQSPPSGSSASGAPTGPSAWSDVGSVDLASPGAQPFREQQEEDEDHHGFFTRLTVGAGLGHVRGSLPPEPGFKPIDDLSHTAPVVGAAVQLGGGAGDLALAGELYYERMLRRVLDPSRVSFGLIGLGIAASYYLDNDWFLTGHLRWVLMTLYKAEIPCWADRLDATGGPGVGLTVGKEWFDRKNNEDDDPDNGLGVALQGNYAKLYGNPELRYMSGLVLLSFTHF